MKRSGRNGCGRRVFRRLGPIGLAILLADAAVAAPRAWVTNADRTQLLAPAAPVADSRDAVPIRVDPTRRFQPITGFGFTLTGGGAELLQRMSSRARTALLQELFGRGPNDIGVSWLRISIGASDMDSRVFTYDDGPPDPTLARFSLAQDERQLIPTLREILAIQPGLPILASPWSPPGWMKTNSLPKGGSLRPEMGEVYAGYLVRYLRGMAEHGIPIWGVTLQNEPENASNTPSMLMAAAEQAALIGDHVGPAFRAAGLTTRILTYDHNVDHPAYPLQVENDPHAARFVAGAAFHLYEGDPVALAAAHAARPDKPLWLTEQMVIDDLKFGRPTPVAQPLARVALPALNNWAQGVLLWNLAADPSYGPHTDGGCSVCEGAVTLDGDRVERNAAYATVAQFAPFVPPGSVRIATFGGAELPATAFQRPDGELVLVVANVGAQPRRVRAAAPPGTVVYAVPPGGGLTITWPSQEFRGPKPR